MPTPRIFTPRLDILPDTQRRLWEELRATPEGFVLYGGIALALRLGHRQSVDFDFFADRPIDPQQLLRDVPYLAGATVTRVAPNTLNAVVDRGGPVRLSFFGVPALARIREPELAADSGVLVASLPDLAGTKVAVVQQRAEAKDYIDIDALLTLGGLSLPEALAAGAAVYGRQFNPQVTLKALCWFGEPELAALPEDLKDRLRAAVRRVELDDLPAVDDEAAP